MGKQSIVIALFCIIAFAPLSVMAGESGTFIGKGNVEEAYIVQWESGKMILKKTDGIDKLLLMSPYEVSEEAYMVQWDSATMKPALRSANIHKLMSMPAYEANMDVTSYSHSNILSARASQPSGTSFDSEAPFVPQQCDWCYDQAS